MKKALARGLRVSPALVVAMLALFVAVTGSAVATTSALITGAQIKNGSITGADVKNKSLTSNDIRGQLRGARGLPGVPGTKGDKGDKGVKGDKGETGQPGPFPTTLPAGKTLKGSWAVGGYGTGDQTVTDISFPYPLADAPVPHLIAPDALPPPGCSGTVANPGADAGHLCIFRGSEDRIEVVGNYNPENGVKNQASTKGIVVYATNSSAFNYWTGGTWAVTAS